MDAYMDSEWIPNGCMHGFKHGFIQYSEWIRNEFIMVSSWIHTWIHNGFRLHSGKKRLGLLSGIIPQTALALEGFLLSL